MNLDLRRAIPVLVALAALGVIGFQTLGALRAQGPWQPRRKAPAVAADPYLRLDRIVEAGHTGTLPSTLRDPFGYGSASALEAPVAARAQPRPQAPPEPEKPVLTAIVSDADPRAVLRYEGRNYTVKTGDLFADFHVVSVNAERVVLEAGGRRIVLDRPSKGD